MTAHAVKLTVSANVPKDCSFWPEDDSWNASLRFAASQDRSLPRILHDPAEFQTLFDAKKKITAWKIHGRKVN